MDARPHGRPLRPQEAYELLHIAVYWPLVRSPQDAKGRAAPVRSKSLSQLKLPLRAEKLPDTPLNSNQPHEKHSLGLERSISCVFPSNAKNQQLSRNSCQSSKRRQKSEHLSEFPLDTFEAFETPAAAFIHAAASAAFPDTSHLASKGSLCPSKGVHSVASCLTGPSMRRCLSLASCQQHQLSKTRMSCCRHSHWHLRQQQLQQQQQQQPLPHVHRFASAPRVALAPTCHQAARSFEPLVHLDSCCEQQMARSAYPSPLAATHISVSPLPEPSTEAELTAGHASSAATGKAAGEAGSAEEPRAPAATGAAAARWAAKAELQGREAPGGLPVLTAAVKGAAHATQAGAGLGITATRCHTTAAPALTRRARSSHCLSVASPVVASSSDLSRLAQDAASAAAVAQKAVAAAAFSISLRAQHQQTLPHLSAGNKSATSASLAAAPPAAASGAQTREGIIRPALSQGDLLSFHLRETLATALGSGAGCPREQQRSQNGQRMTSPETSQQQEQHRAATASQAAVQPEDNACRHILGEPHSSTERAPSASQPQNEQTTHRHQDPVQLPISVHKVVLRSNYKPDLSGWQQPPRGAVSAVNSPLLQRPNVEPQPTLIQQAIAKGVRRCRQVQSPGLSSAKEAEALQQTLPFSKSTEQERRRRQHGDGSSSHQHCEGSSRLCVSRMPLQAPVLSSVSSAAHTLEIADTRGGTTAAAASEDEEQRVGAPHAFAEDSLCGISFRDACKGEIRRRREDGVSRSIFELKPEWVAGLSVEPRLKTSRVSCMWLTATALSLLSPRLLLRI